MTIRVLSIWLALTLCKFLIAAQFPLFFDENYYWVWSQRLQLSYFDHPPMVAWLFWVSNLFPSGAEGLLRWPFVLLGSLTILIWLKILQPTFSQAQSLFFVWLTGSSFLLGLGSIVGTPDVPVVFFWSLSALFFKLALEQGSIKFYVLTGLAIGLGFCAKYHIVLIVPCFFIYLFWEKKWKLVSPLGAVLTALFSLLSAFPVLAWNFKNDFRSFAFQIDHGISGEPWDPYWTLSYVIGQIALISPFLALGIFRGRLTQHKYLLVMSFFPLLFFFATSFKGLVELNWPIVAYPALLALATLYASGTQKTLAVFYTSIIGALAVTVLLVPSFNHSVDKLKEPFVYKPVASLSSEFKPLYLSTYQMAATVWQITRRPHFKLYQMSRHDFFDELTAAPPLEKLFYLARHKESPLPTWLIKENPQIKIVKQLAGDLELLEVVRN